MRTGLTPSTVQWCRCGRFRGRNLADSVAVRRRFRAGVGVFCQTLIILFAASSHSSAFKNIALATPWLPAGLPPRRSRAMHAPPGRLDRSREAIGAGRGREERQCRGPPLGLRPLEAERPVVGKLRHEADRQSDGDVAGRPAPEPRARPARAVRERRGRDPPRPRAALGQGHDFAYPMCPSRHFRFVREYHYIIFLIQCFGIKCRILADERSGCVYRADGNGPIASYGAEDRSDRAGENATRGRTVAGERARPGRLLAGKPSPRCMRRSRTGSRARYGRCRP